MKKIFIFLLISLIFPTIIFAGEDLLVTYKGTEIFGPVFDVHNMLPGDNEYREISVTNKTSQIQTISVVVKRTGPDNQTNPKLETAIDFSIWENNQQIFNTNKLINFFNQQSVFLGKFYPNEPRVFDFKAFLPLSTSNLYQNKQVIFDLIFGINKKPELLINEVYYQVDKDHGFDSLFDRKIHHFDNWFVWEYKPGCDFENIDKLDSCQLNKINRNSFCKRDPNYKPQLTDKFFNFWYKDNYWCNCNHQLKNNDEWLEIINLSDQEVSINNWVLIDNSLLPTIIKTNKKIPANGFALISQNKNTWNYWLNKNSQAIVIELNKPIGNGLGNYKDHLYLINPFGEISDKVGWGKDKFVWDSAVGLANLGYSIYRNPNGYDTDLVSDWFSQNPPTPGY